MLDERATVVLRQVTPDMAAEIVKEARRKNPDDKCFSARIRTLKFNLRANQGLRQNIILGYITPSQLVCMSAHEMRTPQKHIQQKKMVAKELLNSKVDPQIRQAQEELFVGITNANSTRKARIGYAT